MIVVTGADGIVGRAVCALLRTGETEFIPIVRHRKAYTPIEALVLNLANQTDFEALSGKRIDGIIHLAAAVPHSSYYPDTAESAELTRSIDRNVLSFCKQVDCPVVYMSTCGLYDRISPIVKCEEKSEIKIESPYFEAKFAGEQLFSAEALSVILRLAAPIGPGQKSTVVLSRFVIATRKNTPIRLWGTGKREQNFVDVRDVARLIHQAMLTPKRSVLNVASEKPTTMVELAKIVIEILNKGSVVFDDKIDPKENETARYSIEKAYELYKWKPEYLLYDSIRMIAEEEFE